MQPIAAAALPSTRIWPPVLFMRATRYGSRFCRCSAVNFFPASSAPMLSCHRFRLLAELLGERLLHLAELDREELGEHAVVDHVLDEAAELRVRAHVGHDLVERHRIENEVVAQRVELQRLVIDHDAARLEREHVVFRALRVHRDQNVDFLLAAHVPAMIRADRVPRRQAGDVRRKQVLPRHGDAHLEDGPQQDEVRRLAARSVDRGDLDAEVVDDFRARLRALGLCRRK